MLAYKSSALRAKENNDKKCTAVLPMGLWFFNHAMVGGGIPVASHVKVTGLLIVSTTISFSGPSMLGGTVKRQEKIMRPH